MSKEDSVLRRIVVEYGQVYVYMYATDGNGKVLDEDRFKQPYRLTRREAIEEADECYSRAYDWVNEIVNFPSASDQGGGDSVDG